MRLKSNKIAIVTGGLLALALIAAPSAQAATNLSICSNKATSKLSLKSKCTSQETKISRLSQLNGAAGTNGTNGNQGNQGATGATGATGTAGTNGAAGTAGTNGTNGAAGTAGTNGTNGAAGPAGADGLDGAAGAAGADGLDGLAGIGLTQASVGEACLVDLDGAGTGAALTGVFAWAETVAANGIYVMVCNTNPPV